MFLWAVTLVVVSGEHESLRTPFHQLDSFRNSSQHHQIFNLNTTEHWSLQCQHLPAPQTVFVPFIRVNCSCATTGGTVCACFFCCCFFPHSPLKVPSLFLKKCIYFFNFSCWGKTLSGLHAKPLPFSLPLHLPPSSCFPVGAGKLLPPSSRHKQELTDLLTSTNTHTHTLFFPVCLCPISHSFGCWLCTDLILDYRPRGQVFALFSSAAASAVVVCSHCCVRTGPTFSEKCFHGKMSHRPLLSLDLLSSYLQSVTFSQASHLSVGKTDAELIPCWQSSSLFFSFFFLPLLLLSSSLNVCYSTLMMSACARKIPATRNWQERWSMSQIKASFYKSLRC